MERSKCIFDLLPVSHIGLLNITLKMTHKICWFVSTVAVAAATVVNCVFVEYYSNDSVVYIYRVGRLLSYLVEKTNTHIGMCACMWLRPGLMLSFAIHKRILPKTIGIPETDESKRDSQDSECDRGREKEEYGWAMHIRTTGHHLHFIYCYYYKIASEW